MGQHSSPLAPCGRRHGFLPQDISLFAGTIKENISRFQDSTHGNGAEIDAKAVAAARACFAHELILQLPNGYDSVLGWGGRGLSAGQAQRVGLARALYDDPPLILLDEPNAHLDATGEGQLVDTLMELKKRGAAVLVVAHRMGVLAAVDKIMVLREVAASEALVGIHPSLEGDDRRA